MQFAKESKETFKDFSKSTITTMETYHSSILQNDYLPKSDKVKRTI